MSRSRRTDQYGGPRGGLAAVEFALVAPFIILVMLGGTDLTIFMRTMMRVDETGTQISLAVTQYQSLYDSDFTYLFNAAQTVAGTTPVTGLLGATIITGIVNSGGRQTIAWQRRSPSATFPSQFGTAIGSAPNAAEQLSVAVRRNADRSGSLHFGNALGPQRQPYERVQRDVDTLVCALPTSSGTTVDDHSGELPMTRRGLLKRGSVAIMTGLLAIPLVAMTGLAIDLARIWLVRSRLQMSLDAAVLVVARILRPAATPTDGLSLFWADFGRTSNVTNAG